MPRVKLPYTEGSVFLVPLRDGGYGRGVVARMAPKGKILLGYFFGPRLHSPDCAGVNDLAPSRAILMLQFGDLGLINGAWKIIGAVPNWDRSQWPMPLFARHDPLGHLKPRLVRYSDDDPSRVIEETAVDDASGYPPDQLSGYGAAEVQLTRAMSVGFPLSRILHIQTHDGEQTVTIAIGGIEKIDDDTYSCRFSLPLIGKDDRVLGAEDIYSGACGDLR